MTVPAGEGLLIRDATAGDEPAWRRLWAAYLAFYQAAVPEAVTAATWARSLDPGSAIFARLAERAGAVIGFTLFVLHEGTWTVTPVCYLEDLFVDPAARGTGVGRALIEDLIARAGQRRWSHLYWHTRLHNAPARTLYDRFVPADDYVRYRIFLKT